MSIKKRIVLLGHNLRAAGAKSVGQNIVKTLPVIAPMHDYLIIIPKNCGYPDFSSQKNVTVLEYPFPGGLVTRWWWEKRVLQHTIKAFNPDWIWALGNIGLPAPPCNQSVLFHISHFLYESSHYGYTRIELVYKKITFLFLLNYLIRKGLKNSHRVYCQTETARIRFSKKYSYPLDRISICKNSVSLAVNKSTDFPYELKKLKGNFLLFVLTKYYSHKNLERIVNMFDRYRSKLQGVVCVMPVQPDQEKRAAQLIAMTKKMNLSDQIIFVNPIDQERLGEFFYAADVMFLPTLLESFSSTYIEAMYLEKPILTSNLDFAKDICGSAAEYVNPYSLESMCNGVLRLKNDRKRREELILLGKQQFKMHVQAWPEILKNVLDQEKISY